MAEIKKIKLSGVEYDIQASTATALTTSAGDANTPVYFSGGKPVACTSLDLNTTGSAAKLTTARSIDLNTAVEATATNFDGSGNITIPVTEVKEAYLSWGGKNLVGNVSPIGASLSSEHSANRLAYLNPAALAFEYSDNGGSSWSAMSIADSTKVNFVTTSGTFSVGNGTTVTTNHRSRVTITAQNGTTGYVYTRPRKMLIDVNTSGHGLSVTVEVKTGASGAAWQTLGTYELSGWSGWNEIPLDIATLGGSKTQTSNYWYMRLTFATTSVHSSYTTSKSSIMSLRLFGDTSWTSTSNMGKTGHLYSYDSSQNATFPAKVTATSFSGSIDPSDLSVVVPLTKGGTGANLTYSANGIIRFSSSGSYFSSTPTASGAFYATSANGSPTFGTLPVAQGGTGLTSNPSMLVNLGSTSAASVLASAPRPGITGTLAVGHGGTGVTSNPSMLVNLGSTSAASVFAASPRPGITGTLAIGHGGTGATTAAGAITNLGAMDLTSAQTASGVKTFSNGIKIGSATLSYNSTASALVLSFS